MASNWHICVKIYTRIFFIALHVFLKTAECRRNVYSPNFFSEKGKLNGVQVKFGASFFFERSNTRTKFATLLSAKQANVKKTHRNKDSLVYFRSTVPVDNIQSFSYSRSRIPSCIDRSRRVWAIHRAWPTA